MPHINRSALLPFSDQKMFDLVNDVASYPHYMEGCVRAVVLEQTPASMVAALHLEKAGIKMQFTTSNVLSAPKSIVMNLHEGPFESFEGRWFFQSLSPEACKVILDLQFTLSGRLVNMAMRKLFDNVSNNMVDAMVKRARDIYGQCPS